MKNIACAVQNTSTKYNNLPHKTPDDRCFLERIGRRYPSDFFSNPSSFALCPVSVIPKNM